MKINEEEIQETPEYLWKTFWKDIVCSPDGTINLEQLKLELADFTMVMNNASLVYDDVTMGRISKLNTDARAVIDEINNVQEKFYYGIVKDDIEFILNADESAEDKIDDIKEYLKKL